MPNKGFALVAAGQFETRLQEFGLRGSYLDGSWQAMPSITTQGVDYFNILVTTFLSAAEIKSFCYWVCSAAKVFKNEKQLFAVIVKFENLDTSSLFFLR